MADVLALRGWLCVAGFLLADVLALCGVLAAGQVLDPRGLFLIRTADQLLLWRGELSPPALFTLLHSSQLGRLARRVHDRAPLSACCSSPPCLHARTDRGCSDLSSSSSRRAVRGVRSGAGRGANCRIPATGPRTPRSAPLVVAVLCPPQCAHTTRVRRSGLKAPRARPARSRSYRTGRCGRLFWALVVAAALPSPAEASRCPRPGHPCPQPAARRHPNSYEDVII